MIAERPEILQTTPTAISLPELVITLPTEQVPTLPPTDQPQPTQTTVPPLVADYVLGGVDLGSGKPVSLEINLPEGGILPSSWASTLAFHNGDPADIFDPNRGVIYSYQDEGLTVTWAHSGASDTGKPLFADNLDRYMRKTNDERTMSLSMAQEKANSLVGAKAVICEDETGKIQPMMSFDSTGDCPGIKVNLEIVSFTIIPEDQVSEYDKLSIGIWQWMKDKFPNAGFDTLTAGDSWVMRFCMGGYYDQPGSKNWYFINRGVIAFRVLK